MILNLLGFLFFICFLFLIYQLGKFSLYLLYLWQLKEYRFDRLILRLVYRADRNEFLAYFNFLNFYPLKYPRITLRIILSLVLVTFTDYQLLFLFYRPTIRFLYFANNFFLILLAVLVIIYFISPISILIINFLLSALAFPVKKIIIYLAVKKRQTYKHLLVIGITGSYAKSSTKEIISRILSLKYKVLKTQVNTNTEIGVAKTVLFSLKRDHQIFVVEMGAYKKGEIKAICDIVLPKIGIITGINDQHLALFRSRRNIKEAKYELIKSLPASGLALFNGANKENLSLYRRTKRCRKLVYGRRMANFEEALDAGAILAKRFGVSQSKLNRILPSLKRMLQIKSARGFRNGLVLNDSYNSNPDGFAKALKVISQYKKRKLVVTAGIIELGKAGKAVHNKLGQALAKTVDKIFLTNNNFYNDMVYRLNDQEKQKFSVINSKKDIIFWVKENFGQDWLVLFEGRVPISYINPFLKKYK